MNINFTNITKLVKPRGVIHVGANTCQELPLYLEHRIEHRLWIEPIKNLDFPEGETIMHAVIYNKNIDLIAFYKANNNGESSSLLKPIKHKEIYQDISFEIESETIEAITLRQLLYITKKENYNYLVLDIQGMELEALKSLGKFTNHFDVIITEAYTEELYLGCGKLHEIEQHLTNYSLIEFAPEVGKGWGDAAFIRKDLLK